MDNSSHNSDMRNPEISMSRSEEGVWTGIACGLLLLALAFLAGEGNALAALLYFGVPLSIFLGLAVAAGKGVAAGWLFGTTTAFIAVSLFEALWENFLYKGANSKPGFVFLFMCAPLSMLGLVPARMLAKRVQRKPILVRLLASFSPVFLFGSAVVLFSLVTHR